MIIKGDARSLGNGSYGSSLGFWDIGRRGLGV